MISSPGRFGMVFALTMALFVSRSEAGEPDRVFPGEIYRENVEPILAEHCYGCHGNGIKKGRVTLDAFLSDESLLARKDLWHDVLKNVRAGLMPPADKSRLSADDLKTLEDWIKRQALGLDPNDPDPGRATLRRLNRVEYRNTIRELMGIEFRTDEEFPADDSGYGFDNIGDVLTVSPLLLEKYMQAAETIVGLAVPPVSLVTPTSTFYGTEFRGPGLSFNGADRLTFYKEAKATRAFELAKSGDYRVTVELSVRGNFDFDPGRARVDFKVDDQALLNEEFGWENNRTYQYKSDHKFDAGPHQFSIDLTPLVPLEKKRTSLDFRVISVKVDGPLGEENLVRPANFALFFDRDDPKTPEGRKAYAQEVLKRFAGRAFRRPVDSRTLSRLVAIAEQGYADPAKTVEQGISRAMIAVLASPRFLFRIEDVRLGSFDKNFALVDELSLASRLSYFLWSTMPDEELLRLANQGELRKNLEPQVKRMLADGRSNELIRNFVGQWLQARDDEHFPIQHKQVLRRDGIPAKMDGEVSDLRKSMRLETEAYFAHVVQENRPILELIDSDYAFVNEALAKIYEIPGVSGREIRKVTLPEGSPRGGMLTQAGILMITSNPSRTSPVKRGNFILENFLGTPTPPPPPDIPSLEDTLSSIRDREPTMREVMEVHRANALCASCHSRMDPLGLAFENFNALGIWRKVEKKQTIDASGRLVNGRTFQNVSELKAILKTENRVDFYRCLSEKLLTYALGRGVDSIDVETVDQLVSRLESHEGRFGELLMGVIESAPFQKRRVSPSLASSKSTASAIPPSPASNQGANP